MKRNIAVIDYGLGNIRSVINMLENIGANAIVALREEDIINADKYILPGVGAFNAGVRNIEAYGFREVLEEQVLKKGKMILGICLGMQLMGISSEEGSLKGFSWLAKRVVRFREKESVMNGLKIPHMGWNVVNEIKTHRIFSNIKHPMRFYFVHSYHMECEGADCEYGLTNYGYNFVSVVIQDNIIGVQFHPEKSHIFGMQMIKNFWELK